jgi:hypothetical protein
MRCDITMKRDFELLMCWIQLSQDGENADSERFFGGSEVTKELPSGNRPTLLKLEFLNLIATVNSSYTGLTKIPDSPQHSLPGLLHRSRDLGIGILFYTRIFLSRIYQTFDPV